MEISIKRIMVETYTSADIYVASMLEKRQVKKHMPSMTKVKTQFRLILRHKGNTEYISEWIYGNYVLGVENNPRPKFISIKQADLHGFNSTPSYTYKYKAEILVLDYKPDPEERRMKCYIPPAFYHTFPDFQLVFVNAVEEAILKIFN